MLEVTIRVVKDTMERRARGIRRDQGLDSDVLVGDSQARRWRTEQFLGFVSVKACEFSFAKRLPRAEQKSPVG
jgi:hypothetical protein